jgi:hypothetical protein
MPDNSPKGVFEKVEAKSSAPSPSKGAKGDKRRQQLVIAGTFALVLIAYLTYRKMQSGNKANADGGATVTPATGNPEAMPMTTATNVPSGNAAPETTVPFAMPTDTTGGGAIPQTSGTPSVGAPSSTVPEVKPPAPVGPPTGSPQAQTPTPHPAAHPALSKPVVKPHANGAAALPGGGGYASLVALDHPTTAAGTV